MNKTACILWGVLFLVACGGDDGGNDTSDEPGDAWAASDSTQRGDSIVAPPATLTDDATGLMWQTRPQEDWVLWQEAMDHCEALQLEGYEDWRLPTIEELRTLVAGCPDTMAGGACQVVGGCGDACYSPACDGCEHAKGPGPKGCYMDAIWGDSCAYHWSSSTYVGGSVFSPTTLAWHIQFNLAWVWSGNVNDNHMVARCVRTIP